MYTQHHHIGGYFLVPTKEVPFKDRIKSLQNITHKTSRLHGDSSSVQRRDYNGPYLELVEN